MGISVEDCKGLLPIKDDYPSPIEKIKQFPLSEERTSITHKFEVDNITAYLIVGMYSDGKPGEILIRIQKEGSTLSGALKCFSMAVSVGLQCGIPIEWYIDKFKYVRFEPEGMTKNPNIPVAHSIIDYVFRWLETKFCKKSDK